MVKWLVRKYLNKILDNKVYQRLSLEQELGYADKLLADDEREILKEHTKVMADITSLIHVLNYVVN